MLKLDRNLHLYVIKKSSNHFSRAIWNKFFFFKQKQISQRLQIARAWVRGNFLWSLINFFVLIFSKPHEKNHLISSSKNNTTNTRTPAFLAERQPKLSSPSKCIQLYNIS